MKNIFNINLIVVHPFGRAGSVFFQSLLDGHSNIYTLPCFKNFYPLFPDQLLIGSDAYYNFFQDLRNKYPEIFDTSKGYFGMGEHSVSGAFGERYDEHILTDLDELLINANRLTDKNSINGSRISRRDFFVLFHLAFAMCHGKNPEDVSYILYHPHKIYALEPLLDDFPELYFVGMTRNIYANWSSWKTVTSRRHRTSPERLSRIYLFETVHDYIDEAYRYSLLQNKIKNLKFIDLNKLHKRNITALREISDWLSICYEDSMSISTFCGKQWGGNASSLNILSTFDPQKVDQLSNLNDNEMNFIASIGFPVLDFFGYDRKEVALPAEGYDKAELVDVLAYVWDRVKLELLKPKESIKVRKILRLMFLWAPKYCFTYKRNFNIKVSKINNFNLSLEMNKIPKGDFLE